MYTFCLLNNENIVVDTFLLEEYDLDTANDIHQKIYSDKVLFDCEKEGIIGYKDQKWNGQKFLPVPPYSNWIWDEETQSYIPPVLKPANTEKGEVWDWDQDSGSWIDRKENI